MDFDKMMEEMKKQTAEFDALQKLYKAFTEMPAVVDDDYPEMRHYYESEMRDFIDKIKANGRLD